MFDKRIFMVAVCVVATLLAACAPGAPAPAPTLAALAQNPTATEPPATPTELPSSTPTSAPTLTPTPTQSPTPTVTPTPLPMSMVGGCAEIFKPGYYKVTGDINAQRLDCFIVQSHNVVLDCDGHKITGRNLAGYGVHIRKFNFPLLETPTNVEIKNCKMTGLRTGIVAEAGNNIYIHDNDLSKNHDDTNPQRYGIFLGVGGFNGEAGGVRFDGVQNARIENNQANDQAVGFDIRNSDRITLKGNTADRNSAYGFSLTKTTNSEIVGNTARDNVRSCTWGDNKTVGRGCDAAGILLINGSSHDIIRDNVITGDNANGIFIKAHAVECGDDNLIQNNKIIGALYNAIELGFCKNNKIIGNEMAGSVDGVLFGFTQNTEIRNNKLSNMRNHGISAWNTRNSVVDGNQITNSYDGILFFWDSWDTKQFAFLPPSPDKYASRDNVITNNVLRENSNAAIHLINTTNSRIDGNQFFYNAKKDLLLEGATNGNIIPMLTPPSAIPAPLQTPAASPTR